MCADGYRRMKAREIRRRHRCLRLLLKRLLHEAPSVRSRSRVDLSVAVHCRILSSEEAGGRRWCSRQWEWENNTGKHRHRVGHRTACTLRNAAVHRKIRRLRNGEWESWLQLHRLHLLHLLHLCVELHLQLHLQLLRQLTGERRNTSRRRRKIRAAYVQAVRRRVGRHGGSGEESLKGQT